MAKRSTFRGRRADERTRSKPPARGSANGRRSVRAARSCHVDRRIPDRPPRIVRMPRHRRVESNCPRPDAASVRACLRANNHRADAHCSALVDARTTPGEPRAGLGSDVPASHFRYHFAVAATRSAKPSSAAALDRRLLSQYLSRNRRCLLARYHITECYPTLYRTLMSPETRS